MATVAINAGEADLPNAALTAALARLAPGAPIAVMVHGFRYCPVGRAANPHRHILSDSPETDHWKSISWPGRLGLRGPHGLAIGFGWSAGGSIWHAYAHAPRAGADLAVLLRRLHRHAPGHPVHLIAHSLGARVALIGASQARHIHRAILIHPAMFRREAAQLDLGQAEIFSVLGAENTAFDLLLRAALPLQGATLGRAGPARARWLDLRLSHDGTCQALAGMGYRIAAPRARICHWSGYLRDGVWDLYRALVHRPADTPMQALRGAIASAQSGHERAETRLASPA